MLQTEETEGVVMDEIEVSRTGSYASMQEAMEAALEFMEERRIDDVSSVYIDSEHPLEAVGGGERLHTTWRITVRGRMK